MTTKIPRDAVAFYMLSAQFGLTPITAANIKSRLETKGALTFPPDQKTPLVSREVFRTTVEEFCNELPGVQGRLGEIINVKANDEIHSASRAEVHPMAPGKEGQL